jgi:hypothetical protein
MPSFNNPLEHLEIASPCLVDWETMTGDVQVRFCGQCQQNVYNLSEMSRTEAEQLITEREGRLCVRYYQRTDGTVLTQDCPVGLRKIRQQVAKAAALVAAMLTGVLTLTGVVQAANRHAPPPTDLQVITGGISPDLLRRDRLSPIPSPVMGDVVVPVKPVKVTPVPRPVPIMGEPVLTPKKPEPPAQKPSPK